MFFVRQNATHKVVVGPAVAVGDGFTPVTTLALTSADEAEVILHDNGTIVAINAYTWAAITTADGYYHLTLQTGITSTVGHMTVVVNDDSLCLPLRADFTIIEEAVYDQFYAASAAGALQPTTAGRTLDVSTGGEAGIDWANIGTPGATQDLSATTIDTVDTATAATSVTNAVTVGTMNANTITNSAIANDAIGATEIADGAIDAATFAANAIDAAALATDAVNEIVDQVWDEVMSGHATNGQAGWATMLAAYGGPRGPGIYVQDDAANTATVNGTDGTATNPVSTIAAAKTIGDSLGVNRIYITNNTDIQLLATIEDYEFVGIGAPAVGDCEIDLNTQDVDGCSFYNLAISGVQGGTTRAHYVDCVFATATIHCLAYRCGFTDAVTGVTFSNNDDNILEGCFSMVAGNSAPVFLCNSVNLDLSIRHYSGGIEIGTSNATATISIETDGQVIFNAACDTGTVVVIRGNCTVTDNATMTALTEGARIDRDAINAEVVDVLKTDTSSLPGQEAPTLTPTLEEAVMWLYKNFRNRKSQTATQWSLYADNETTVDSKATVSDDATTAIKQEIVSGP